MNQEPWIVKTRSGSIWGKIHRVVIDSASRQIVSADVRLGDNDRVVRVPWSSLDIRDDDIVLGAPEEDIRATMRMLEGSVPDTVTLEEAAPVCPA
jgi:hypothetical protein